MPGERYRTPMAILVMFMGSEFVMAEEPTETLDDAFLEYLGEWESAEGDWVDPLEFAEYELAEQDREPECSFSDEECLQQRREKDES